MKRAAMLILTTAAFGVGLPSEAAIYTATLSGANENPATPSVGTGNTTVTIDTTAHTLQVIVSFSGLTSGTTASHIHCCVAPNGNAGVATTTPTFTGFPLGVTSGSYNHVFDTTLASSWNPAFITGNGGTPAGAEAALAAGLAAGQAYLNIHTTNFPSGEIRGFLAVASATSAVVPTLSQWMIGLLGVVIVFAGYFALRRRSA
ncbi:MAG TPA: IPTL-CTERM sorting domain-containing protein [Casimicrobiaceae bacterium]|jgi:hypothetical protein